VSVRCARFATGQFSWRPGAGVSPGYRPNRGASVDHVDEAEETSCKRCRRRLKVAAAGLCAVCAAIVATPAVSIAAPLPSAPPSLVKRVAWSPGDSEPFHPAEPDPTFDGPEYSVMGTMPTFHLVVDPYQWRPSRRLYNGPRDPKYIGVVDSERLIRSIRPRPANPA
jgi:hypothetical protein